MKRTSTEPPYLSFYLMVRNSSKTIEGCLKSIRERAPEAEIVVVDTCSSDDTPEIAQRYADVFEVYRGPLGNWDEEMPWFDDASSARQRGLELCSGVWRCWIDDDDYLPGPEEVERLLKLNAQWKPGREFDQIEGDTQQEPQGLEEILREIETGHPIVTMIRCPYLYERDEHDQAHVYQWRERFIKWSDPPKFVWQEKSHDVLVPIGAYRPPRCDLAHFLFVHNREFTPENVTYSHSRHYKVMSDQYEAGEITTRRCLYLATYSAVHCPNRRMEYLRAAYNAATTNLDRYRVHIDMANYYAEQGLGRDALEHYGAAFALAPTLPDAYYAAAEWAAGVKDWSRAILFLDKGTALECGMESYITPRHHVIKYPTMLAEVLRHGAKLQIAHGYHAQAAGLLTRAAKISEQVVTSEAVGADKTEAYGRGLRIHHEQQTQELAIEIDRWATYLSKNDEPEKLEKLLDAIPHTLQDHPIVMGIEKSLRPILRHKEDWGAYVEEYNDNDKTGYMFSPEFWFQPKETPLRRVRWIGDWIAKYAPNARILDIGCCDGLIAIPVMRLNPGVTYVGLDINQSAITRFQELLTIDQYKELASRVEHVGVGGIAGPSCEPSLDTEGAFDLVLWTEIIEHVPDPVGDIQKLHRFLKPGGTAIVSTPWGSFDAGHPPAETEHGTPRGHVGHLRALTPRDTVGHLRAGGFEPVEMERLGNDNILGNEMVISAMSVGARPHVRASFAVPSALWDWTSRTIENEGMGASEETIAYLAQHMAPERMTEVFGPIPLEDVHLGVPYWKREQIRHLAKEPHPGKIVVSRSPSYGKHLDEMIGVELPKILWLQDAYYADLTAETAEHYEAIVVVSEWHKQAMHERHGVPLDRMHVAYNFLIADQFGGEAPERKRDRFIYASSPDRGLIPLLELWPRIKSELPDATLGVYYGWRGCVQLGAGGDDVWMSRFSKCRQDYERLRYQDGITDCGMVPHRELANAFRSSGIWCYPTDFTETGCLTAVKARASGVVPVTSTLAALSETARCDLATLVEREADDYDDQILDGIMAAMDATDEQRKAMADEAIEQYRIENAALPIWRKLLDA